MKHIKKFNEDQSHIDHSWWVKSAETARKWDLPKKKSKKIEHQLDPRILAHNIKHNIDDFSEEQILNLFLTYAEQNKK